MIIQTRGRLGPTKPALFIDCLSPACPEHVEGLRSSPQSTQRIVKECLATDPPASPVRLYGLCRFYGLCHFSVLDHSAFLELTGRRRIAFVQRLISYLLYPLKAVGLSLSHACRFLTLCFPFHAKHRPIAVKNDFRSVFILGGSSRVWQSGND
jgi:hypothetical protein